MTKIHIIVDISGSFAEMDKKDIQFSLLQTIATLHSGFDFEYHSWSNNIVQLSDFSFNVGGSAKLETLAKFIDTISQKSRLIVLTDGNFTRIRELEVLKNAIDTKNVLLCFVAVGADANLLPLKKITNKVYQAIDIVASVNEVCYGDNIIEALPESLGDIVW